MKSRKVQFRGHSGMMLAARLDEPARPARACALFAHCFTCSKDILAARRIAARLAAQDIAVLRFDFTGLGHSDGEFANTSFTSNVQDLVAAADWMRTELAAPHLVIGHSLGGAAIIAAAPLIPEARAVVTIGAPFDPGHVLQNFACDLEAIERDGQAEVSLAGRTFAVSREFVRDVSEARLGSALGELRKALLVLHAPLDQTVGIDNATRIFRAARHPKSFVTLDSADHLLTDPADAEYAADIVASWSRRYLDMPETSVDDVPEGVVRSAETSPEKFLQDISVPGVHILADEPKSVGGDGIGLSPYQLVSAGLAACTSMTIRMYARRKQWPLDHVAVDVRHDKIHAVDCADCETKAGKIDVFRRTIHLSGDLSDEQRQRILQIADRCPVHRTLESEIRVETEEVYEAG